MGFLTGKKALIVGLVSSRSIAYGISAAMHREGAELAFACQNEKVLPRVIDMAKEWGSELCFPCDVSQDQEIDELFANLGKEWPKFDIIVHSVAFAPGDQLQGDYLDNVTRDGFRIAHDVSSYSLAALCKAAKPYLNENASILSMTYLGAERVVTNYNVMGLAKASLEANIKYLAASLGPIGTRINGISAGPIRTLAASGIKGFKKMLDFDQKTSPLRQNVTIDQVGNVAAFLCSDLASGMTGEIVHVDCGFHIMGLSQSSET